MAENTHLVGTTRSRELSGHTSASCVYVTLVDSSSFYDAMIFRLLDKQIWPGLRVAFASDIDIVVQHEIVTSFRTAGFSSYGN